MNAIDCFYRGLEFQGPKMIPICTGSHPDSAAVSAPEQTSSVKNGVLPSDEVSPKFHDIMIGNIRVYIKLCDFTSRSALIKQERMKE